MAAERCERCGEPRINEHAGKNGLCTSCVEKLAKLAPPPQEEKHLAASSGKKSRARLVPPTRQGDIDQLYQRHVKARYLRVFVSANESGGFGDLINCLNTSQIVLDCGN